MVLVGELLAQIEKQQQPTSRAAAPFCQMLLNVVANKKLLNLS